MKKILTRLALAGGTLGVIVAGAAAFSAFEAHVVNVTATIENALTVPVEKSGLTFGEMFPEEVGHVTLPIQLSDSFMSTSRVDDVEYIIRQKPKCGIPVLETNPVQYSGFVQVTENADHNFVCPQGSVQLPLLCPYLSKNELNQAGAPTGNGIPAFHGLPGPWTETTTENTQVAGVLSKAGGKISTSWDIDLHTPCFAGECAQDWPKFVTDTNPSVTDPTIYEANPKDEHQMFGCDLWVEVTNISLPPTVQQGLLTVTKIVQGTSTPASAFSLFVDGVSVTSGLATTTGAGPHVVSEGSHVGFSSVIGGQNCDPNGNVTVSTSTPAFCTVTNTWIVPNTGTLNIVKNTKGGDSTFNFTVTGPSSSSPSILTVGGTGSTTPFTVGAGSYSVKETVPADWNLTDASCVKATNNGTFSVDTISGITINQGDNVTCTFNDTIGSAKITVDKIVSDPGSLGGQAAGDFQMTIDGNTVTQGVANVVSIGTHTVGEKDSKGDTVTFSGACNGTNQVTVANKDDVTCTVTNTIPFAQLTINKVVVNTPWNGNNVISDFKLFASNLSGSTQFTSGVKQNVAIGSYFINEEGVSGYQASLSGDCDSNGNITLANGDNKQCTITNTALPGNITLIKAVDSGTAKPTDFLLEIDGSFVTQNSSVAVTANTAHSISEAPHAGYHFVSITGDALCPSVLGGTVTLNEGQAITCTIHNAVGP